MSSPDARLIEALRLWRTLIGALRERRLQAGAAAARAQGEGLGASEFVGLIYNWGPGNVIARVKRRVHDARSWTWAVPDARTGDFSKHMQMCHVKWTKKEK